MASPTNFPNGITVSRGVVIAGTPSGSTASAGDMNISGDYKKNGVAIVGTGATGATGGTGNTGATGLTGLTGNTGNTGAAAVTTNNGLAFTNQTSDAGAQTATLTNGPTAGNPTFWVRITVNGTNLAFPAWPA